MSRIQRGRNRLGQVVHMKSDKFQVERLGRVNLKELCRGSRILKSLI